MSEISKKTIELRLSDSMVQVVKPNLEGSKLRIGLVAARFNSEIVSKMTSLCLARLRELGVPDTNITVLSVPGSYELPLTLKMVAQKGEFDALIALGVIIKGNTDHYHYIAQQVSSGIVTVAIETKTPIIFGVLTTNNEAQAMERTKFGAMYAEDAVEMGNQCRALKSGRF